MAWNFVKRKYGRWFLLKSAQRNRELFKAKWNLLSFVILCDKFDPLSLSLFLSLVCCLFFTRSSGTSHRQIRKEKKNVAGAYKEKVLNNIWICLEFGSFRFINGKCQRQLWVLFSLSKLKCNWMEMSATPTSHTATPTSISTASAN